MDRIKTWLENQATSHPLFVIAVMLMITVVTALGSQHLHFRGDYRIYFEKTYAPLLSYEEMRGTFSKNDNVAVLIVPKSQGVDNAETLQLIQKMTDAAWQIPFSSRVDSLSNFQYTWSEYDDMVVEDLVSEDSTLSRDEINRIVKIALEEPILNGRIIAADKQVSLLNITVQIPGDQDQTVEIHQVIHAVQAMVDDLADDYQNYDFHLTGVLPMNYSFASESRNDVETLLPLMLGLLIVMLAIMLRSLVATIATVLILIVSVITTMGLGGWLGYFLSTGTVNVPIVVLTIAVADCVHIVATTQLAMSEGRSKAEAIRYSIDLNWMPVLITSITTAVGFSTLIMSESPVFVDFGTLSAFGVLIACVFSLTLLPAILRLMPLKAVARNRGDFGMSWLADRVINHYRPLLIVGTLTLILFASLASRNEINDVASEYFSPATEFRQATLTQEDKLSGAMSIDWALYSENEGGINDPQFLQFLDNFAVWLRQQPEVDHVSSLSDTYKRLNKNMHGDDQEWYRLPTDRELAAQYLLLYEMSLPYGLDLNNQIDIDKSAVRITSILQNLGSREIVALEQKAQQWVRDQGTDYRVTGASPGLMFAHIGEQNMYSMLYSMLIAVIIISLLMIFALRSARLGMISLIPNLLPAVVGFGFWSMISGEINLGLSIVSSMTLGIVVDDSVHFLSKYKRARDDGRDTQAAIRYAYISVGRALVITTVVLVVGFSVLSFSSFRLNSDMGTATALIIFMALVIDFLFLPPLLLWLDRDKKGDVEIQPLQSSNQGTAFAAHDIENYANKKLEEESV